MHGDSSVLPAYERSGISRAKAKPKDKPKQVEVRNLTRSDKRKAMDIARDPDWLSEAMAAYERDWRSAGDTSDFNMKTWADLHCEVNWNKFGLPPLTSR